MLRGKHRRSGSRSPLRSGIILLLIGALLSASAPTLTHAQPPADAPDPYEPMISRILASLTPEERVGQLMLVTFEGAYLGEETAITQLITEYNLGGVVLLAENDNINGQINTPRLVQSLTTELQEMAYRAAAATQNGEDTGRSFVPLFIATEHAGNGQPGTEIALGTTPLPSPMALGATWNPAYAQQVGVITGRELSIMGINMLLGPALDVLQQPQGERTFDLGVGAFGGQPYWVGEMGQAYITGVHQGSDSRIAVIAQHFPGLGFADTHPEIEIPVVPRTVEELSQIDLVPYFAVTGRAGNTPARADGLQCANMRYQGRNLRSITRPVCVDEQAAGDLLNQSAIRSWRTRGVMISSPLGTRAIRRYYNVSPFPHRQIAREAFLAGNDLLYLDHFGPQPNADQLANVIDVIRFFAERYQNDPVFRIRVDQSLSRLLRLKLSLYDGDLSLENVLTPPGTIDEVGRATAELHRIAQDSVTLIAPRRESLSTVPARDDNIVIFTDVRLVQQCSFCAAYSTLSVNALEVAIERLYGPYAGAQLRPEQVTSFSFAQLDTYLHGSFEGTASDSTFKTNQRIGEALRAVDWVIFAMLDISPDVASSGVIRSFLDRETEVVERSNLIAFAFGAPTYLSSTEISKFAAYFGLYSAIPPYVDAAARALFQESSYPGALPISLPAAGYNLDEATSPAPNQTIQIVPESLAGRSISPARASDPLMVPLGSRLILRTEPILDRNGSPVPDNTSVEFVLATSENAQARQLGTTENGIARTSFTPSRTGRILITASVGEATRSTTFQVIAVEEAEPPALSGSGTPGTSEAGGTADPARTTTPTTIALAPTSAGASGAPAGDAVPATPPGGLPAGTPGAADADHSPRRVTVNDLVLSLFALSLLSGLGFSAGFSTTLTVDGGIRVVLGSIVAGLVGYTYYGLNGPGVEQVHTLLDDLAPVITTVSAGLVGLIYAWWTLRLYRWR
ncbi:MAG: hypothetical protein GXY36_10220 [Chloroflexi bacterium]|nr:hypothetical protein [Chloroflexota bacterium]